MSKSISLDIIRNINIPSGHKTSLRHLSVVFKMNVSSRQDKTYIRFLQDNLRCLCQMPSRNLFKMSSRPIFSNFQKKTILPFIYLFLAFLFKYCVLILGHKVVTLLNFRRPETNVLTTLCF